MLVVKVELWPFGEEELLEELGRITIANDGEGSSLVADYDVVVTDESGSSGFRVREHFRERGFWALVKRAVAGVS